MTRRRVQLTKQKRKRGEQPADADRPRVSAATHRARSVTAAAARFLART